MDNRGGIFLGSHVLVLRVQLEGDKSACREIFRGTQAQCEREKWGIDMAPFRGPGILGSGLHVITVEEWRRVCAKQIKQPALQ
jgi:hypothetical protein